MPAKTQNVVQLVLTKSIPFKRGRKMCSINLSNANEDTKCISTCFDQTNPMPARTQKAYQHVLTTHLPCEREHNMKLKSCYPSPCVQRISQLLLTKPITSHRWHNMYLNLCWSNPSHASEFTTCFFHATEDRKYLLTCIQHTHPMPKRTQKHLIMCWPKPSNASEDKKCIWIYVDQVDPMHARTRNSSQDVLTKPLPIQRWHKMHLNMFWQNQSYSWEGTMCIFTYVDLTPHTTARVQNVSQHNLTKGFNGR